ncbi:hypothetical protein EZ456_12925 [Pedobacter psychrodurus]|uniref:Uncharacterized protein n=1 Tax=Pedobacter psychrodurus TaxID=2530456 RepID=A0A4R0Q2C1_9SPHI|nr:hypothetical protein [Pedobacter psychrodurus]TCD26493.1 hypothetical protein EZ456_12925 [Pedobacter psychrodurus]
MLSLGAFPFFAHLYHSERKAVDKVSSAPDNTFGQQQFCLFLSEEKGSLTDTDQCPKDKYTMAIFVGGGQTHSIDPIPPVLKSLQKK